MESKNRSKILVIVSRIPENIEIASVYPKERDDEIARCKNSRVRCEKYFVWEILRRAAEQYTGIPFEALNITKNQNGKWVSDKMCFSLSHSSSLVAVAVANTSVGVDVEEIRKHIDGIERNIMTESELSYIYGLTAADAEQEIIKIWTAKESIFKSLDKPRFNPRGISVDEYSVKTDVILSDGKKYALSVSAERLDDVEYMFDL